MDRGVSAPPTPHPPGPGHSRQREWHVRTNTAQRREGACVGRSDKGSVRLRERVSRKVVERGSQGGPDLDQIG